MFSLSPSLSLSLSSSYRNFVFFFFCIQANCCLWKKEKKKRRLLDLDRGTSATFSHGKDWRKRKTGFFTFTIKCYALPTGSNWRCFGRLWQTSERFIGTDSRTLAGPPALLLVWNYHRVPRPSVLKPPRKWAWRDRSKRIELHVYVKDLRGWARHGQPARATPNRVDGVKITTANPLATHNNRTWCGTL